MTADEHRKKQRLTLADLCQAIEEGQIQYTLNDGQYEVTGSDLRRLREDADLPLELLEPLDAPEYEPPAW